MEAKQLSDKPKRKANRIDNIVYEVARYRVSPAIVRRSPRREASHKSQSDQIDEMLMDRKRVLKSA